jgi:hypothetical protein
MAAPDDRGEHEMKTALRIALTIVPAIAATFALPRTGLAVDPARGAAEGPKRRYPVRVSDNHR